MDGAVLTSDLPLTGADATNIQIEGMSSSGPQGTEVRYISASPELLKELTKQTSLGLDLVRRYVGEKAAYSAAEIDSAVAAWRTSADPAKGSPDLVVERVGAFFGAYLIAKLGLEWAVYGDERGKDLPFFALVILRLCLS